MAAAREYDRMVAEMTVRQHNDMTKAILDMVQEAFEGTMPKITILTHRRSQPTNSISKE